jgi:alkaline phosphatase D
MRSPCFLSALFLFLFSGEMDAAPPFQANGIKIGEVSKSSAIIWTRLTENATANSKDGPWFDIEYEGRGFERASDKKFRRDRVLGVRFDKAAKSVRDLQWAVPGVAGQTRVKYRAFWYPDWKITEWASVETEHDFTKQHLLEDLMPGQAYELVVESKGDDGTMGEEVRGSFSTAPAPTETGRDVEFAVTTGQAFWDRNSDDGFVIYDTLLKEHPHLSFFVHTGDIVYYDRLAKTPELANFHWQRTYSLPTNVRFHNRVASYFMKDDHDAWVNDCWPTMSAPEMGSFTFERGLEIFVKQVPMHGRKTYRTQRWGKDLQIWLVEGRDFRSANTDPDGPDKTIWGKEQLEWFEKTFAASDATFRVLISPTPIVGPDRDKGKNDNHSNEVFSHEGNRIRAFLESQRNSFVVCGDRHWQYHSIHPTTGIHEFCCGPASDKHAGGWKQSDFRKEYHQFLRVEGGYLTVKVRREGETPGEPAITFRHHSESGEVVHEMRFEEG